MQKRIVLLLSALLFCGNLFAAGVNSLVFFGDSLSDNGNLYNLVKFIPKSPPYYDGRFANGLIWSELLGNHYQNKSAITYHIFAYGGATALSTSAGFVSPVTLEAELEKFNEYSGKLDKTTALYIFWIGANDYLMDDGSDPEALSSEVVNKISWAMQSLIDQGARYFLLVNLPDLGKTPLALENDLVANLHHLSDLHNKKLLKLAQDYNQLQPQLHIYSMDIHSEFDELIERTAAFNTKHHSKFKVMNRACWTGGLTAKHQTNEEKSLIQSQLNTISANQPNTLKGRSNTNLLTTSILHSPGLKEAYHKGLLQQSGLKPCSSPEQFAFWDLVHPTTTLHEIIAEFAIESIDKQTQDLLTA